MSVVNTSESVSPEIESLKNDLDAQFEVDAGKDAAESLVYRLGTPTTTVTTATTTTVFL